LVAAKLVAAERARKKNGGRELVARGPRLVIPGTGAAGSRPGAQYKSFTGKHPEQAIDPEIACPEL